MAPNRRYFLNFTTTTGLVAAIIITGLFVMLAYGLYVGPGGKEPKEFVVKLADFLLQGALVTVLFAILKAIIDQLPDRDGGDRNS